MYYPYLRGRQNELLAIKELLLNGLLSERVIPIIEPVKLSPTLVNTVDVFETSQRELVLIRNPKVGDLAAGTLSSKDEKYRDRIKDILSSAKAIQHGIIVDAKTPSKMEKLHLRGVEDDRIVAICKTVDCIDFYKKAFPYPVRTVITDESSIRRTINTNRILLRDGFKKLSRNSDYLNEIDEFFSNDHLFYEDENYIGFSDYSIIGEEYTDTGFAPYAVAIHIVYFDKNKNMRVRHFVSTDNDDISDTANKFYQAVKQLVEWNRTQHLNTRAIQEFERIYSEESYPGLGVVKKLSIMHHLELVSKFLDGAL